MNEQDCLELESLRRQQLLLAQNLRAVTDQLNAEAARLQSSHRNLALLQEEQRALLGREKALQDSITSLTTRLTAPADITPGAAPSAPSPPSAVPPPIPPMAATLPPLMSRPEPAPANLPPPPPVAPERPIACAASEAIPSTARAPAAAGQPSFEMRLGTYWLVRIGIVMLLTGMVFFGAYAYKNFIGELGPAGKVTLLYSLSGLLLGLGAWLHRKQERLRNYAQVLFAGGLAAVYFTTYAAHHLPALQVIRSAILDGLLLLAWAAVIFWIADRRKSELLALFGIGLAYYTSLITNVGFFTLYSNLVLTVAAVVFLVRNRWITLPFAGLVATYGAYAYWRFFHDGQWHWAEPSEGLWGGTCFLASYWTVFTAAVFASKHPGFAGRNRVAFLSLNNAAFFVLFLFTMFLVRHGGYWKFSLIYGSVLTALAGVARLVLPEEKFARNSYLVQGLSLITLGFITYFSGMRLSLVLATESVMLLVIGCQSSNRIFRFGSYVTAALAVGWTIDSLAGQYQRPLPERVGVIQGVAVMGFLLFDAWYERRVRKLPPEQLFHWASGLFCGLALLAGFAATVVFSQREYLAAILAVEALLFLAALYVLALPELALFGQAFLVVGQIQCLDLLGGRSATLPWWNPAVVVAVSLGLCHWWQRQRRIQFKPEARQITEGWLGLAFVGILLVWLKPHFAPETWLVCTSLVAIVITAYGILTRAWWLAACGQLFLVISGFEFFRQLFVSHAGLPPRLYALAPVAALALLAGAGLHWLVGRAPSSTAGAAVRTISRLYLVSVVVLSLAWILRFVAPDRWFWVLALAGFILFLWSAWRRNRDLLCMSAAFTFAGFMAFLLRFDFESLTWPNLGAILALCLQQQILRRHPDRFSVPSQIHPVMILMGGLTLWLFVSRWVDSMAPGFYLTAAWAALALLIFAAGFLLRERVYRWLGLGILAAALGRVILIDVWKLETLYRILSFTALGVVLLVLGFIYNRFQEKIREWL